MLSLASVIVGIHLSIPCNSGLPATGPETFLLSLHYKFSLRGMYITTFEGVTRIWRSYCFWAATLSNICGCLQMQYTPPNVTPTKAWLEIWCHSETHLPFTWPAPFHRLVTWYNLQYTFHCLFLKKEKKKKPVIRKKIYKLIHWKI